MKKLLFLLLLSLSLISCGSSSSTANSINVDYSNTFTPEELDSIESAYKTAFAVYNTQDLLLSMVVEPMTFITTQNPSHSNYDASFEYKVYLSKQNSKYIVTENNTPLTFLTLEEALTNCF